MQQASHNSQKAIRGAIVCWSRLRPRETGSPGQRRVANTACQYLWQRSGLCALTSAPANHLARWRDRARESRACYLLVRTFARSRRTMN